MDPEARQLRLRAAELRRLADAIEALTVMRLDQHAGESTVQSPRFDDLLDRLRRSQHDLYSRADELRSSAFHLELRADELDAAVMREAALAAGGPV